MPHANGGLPAAGKPQVDLTDVSLAELRSTGDSALAEAVSSAVSEPLPAEEAAAAFQNKFMAR